MALEFAVVLKLVVTNIFADEYGFHVERVVHTRHAKAPLNEEMLVPNKLRIALEAEGQEWIRQQQLFYGIGT